MAALPTNRPPGVPVSRPAADPDCFYCSGKGWVRIRGADGEGEWDTCDCNGRKFSEEVA